MTQTRDGEVTGAPVIHHIALESSLAQNSGDKGQVMLFFQDFPFVQLALLDDHRLELADGDALLDCELGELLTTETPKGELARQIFRKELSLFLIRSRNTDELHSVPPPVSARYRESNDCGADGRGWRINCTPHRHSC